MKTHINLHQISFKHLKTRFNLLRHGHTDENVAMAIEDMPFRIDPYLEKIWDLNMLILAIVTLNCFINLFMSM